MSACLDSCICSVCKIESDVGMEKHVFQNGKAAVPICPICHSCRHLNSASVKNAGLMIWLPEITQAQLNTTVSVIFASTVNAGDQHASDPDVSRMNMLYRTFESRSLQIEALFGGKNPLFDASSPLFIAQQLDQAKRVFVKLSPMELSQKTEGLRFLAKRDVFNNFIAGVAAKLSVQFPRTDWAKMGVADLDESRGFQ